MVRVRRESNPDLPIHNPARYYLVFKEYMTVPCGRFGSIVTTSVTTGHKQTLDKVIPISRSAKRRRHNNDLRVPRTRVAPVKGKHDRTDRY